MCIHTVLEVTSCAPSYGFLATSCALFNITALWKTLHDMDSLMGVSVVSILMQLCVAFAFKGLTNAMLKERDTLKSVRSHLQQLLDSQNSMWKSVFDATIVCDSTGCVATASAQAMDLFHLDQVEALVGQSFIDLVSPDETDRMASFAQEVMASPSNQAMTIQGTFVRNNGTRMDLHLNAVKVVLNVCNSLAESEFGMLLGMRDEAATGCSVGLQDDELAKDSGRDVPESEVMWIEFDAGTERLSIMDHSSEFIVRNELLSWFPPLERSTLERWIFDEVSGCGDNGGKPSDCIEKFELRIPAVPATSVVAGRAWLEVKPTEVGEAGMSSLPAVLWLHGVKVCRWHASDGVKLAKRRLDSVPEAVVAPDEGGQFVLDEQWSHAGSEELTP
eukprot:CAMPEP_0172686678 /NCGR_PEP_ID=MMETSP1074-20121228/21109_1 /TAXON_ID=2916 /ORGANISM="Ceratium fusus, Strain PA161109" /LENGTH=388 /DNA_ID=CAMNT_0013506021 /DNA_START=404 /DNA_END=1566 /DNA_ORIENTATION=+